VLRDSCIVFIIQGINFVQTFFEKLLHCRCFFRIIRSEKLTPEELYKLIKKNRKGGWKGKFLSILSSNIRYRSHAFELVLKFFIRIGIFIQYLDPLYLFKIITLSKFIKKIFNCSIPNPGIFLSINIAY